VEFIGEIDIHHFCQITHLPALLHDAPKVLFICILRIPISCPRTDERRTQFLRCFQYFLKRYFFVAGAIIGTVSGDLYSSIFAPAAHLARGFHIAMRHMHITAPFDALQTGFFAETDNFLRRFLAKGDGDKSGFNGAHKYPSK